MPFDVASSVSTSPHTYTLRISQCVRVCVYLYLFALKPICFIIEFEIEDDIRFPIVWRVVQQPQANGPSHPPNSADLI